MALEVTGFIETKVTVGGSSFSNELQPLSSRVINSRSTVTGEMFLNEMLGSSMSYMKFGK